MAELSQLPTSECCSAGAAVPSSPADSPIACALDPTSLHDRLAVLRSIGMAALVSRRGRELRFRADREIRDRLEAAIIAEAKCCPFLELSLTRAGEALVLRIDAAPEALPIANEFAAAFDQS